MSAEFCRSCGCEGGWNGCRVGGICMSHSVSACRMLWQVGYGCVLGDVHCPYGSELGLVERGRYR